MWNLSICLAMIDGEQEENKFEELYWQYRDLMYYRARQILDDYSAEDAVNTAFLHIAQNIDKVETAVSPRTKALVMRILENVTIDMYRKQQRERGSLAAITELEHINISQEKERLEDSLLANCILKLSPSYREVILLRYAQGYSIKEVAELLDYSVAKVEKLISRGKKQLNELLEEAKKQ